MSKSNLDIDLLSEVCKVPGAPGFEQRIREKIIQEVTPFVDEVKVDAMGSVHAIKRGKSNDNNKVLIAAHMDEISFIVTHIDDDGYIRFHPLGGFDPKTLTAQRVFIHGSEDVLGVMGTKPIHIMKPEERKKMPDLSDFYIDTGMKKEEVEKLISIGNPITRERDLVVMGPCVNSKSLDNRVSVYILIETLREMSKQELDVDVYGVFTVQEEVGLRGAMTAASGVDPDFGINLDVTLACDYPMAQPHERITSLGDGTAIKVLDGATICDYRMVKYMKEVAAKNKISYQMEILPAGGTDTAGIQRYAKGGSIAGGISIPTRYLHQSIEMANIDDIRATIDLLKASLEGIGSHDWSFS